MMERLIALIEQQAELLFKNVETVALTKGLTIACVFVKALKRLVLNLALGATSFITLLLSFFFLAQNILETYESFGSFAFTPVSYFFLATFFVSAVLLILIFGGNRMERSFDLNKTLKKLEARDEQKRLRQQNQLNDAQVAAMVTIISSRLEQTIDARLRHFENMSGQLTPSQTSIMSESQQPLPETNPPASPKFTVMQ